MILRYHPMARNDLASAFNWSFERSPQAASNLLIRVDEAAQRLLASPQNFPLTSLGCRKARLNKYPFSIIFQWHGDSVTIVSVAHAKRRASFWRNRTTEE